MSQTLVAYRILLFVVALAFTVGGIVLLVQGRRRGWSGVAMTVCGLNLFGGLLLLFMALTLP
jgi:hypothetical protein